MLEVMCNSNTTLPLREENIPFLWNRRFIGLVYMAN